MNRLAKLALVALFACPALLGQGKTTNAPVTELTNKQYKNEVFIIKHREPEDIAKILYGLGSGSNDVVIYPNTTNDGLRTITVRDFPENIAVMKSAIERLDAPAPKAIPVNLRIDVLWASRKELPLSKDVILQRERRKELLKESISPYLSDVVAEISNTLNYKHFAEATTITTTIANNNPASGKAVFAYPEYSDNREYFQAFEWNLTPNITDTDSDHIVSGKLNIKYREQATHGGVSFNNVAIELKGYEKVTLGTTFGDLAMIVVVSAERL